MNENLKLNLAIDKIEKKIAELNIKITKNPEDIDSIKELNILLKNRNKIYTGNTEELKILINKYGSKE